MYRLVIKWPTPRTRGQATPFSDAILNRQVAFTRAVTVIWTTLCIIVFSIVVLVVNAKSTTSAGSLRRTILWAKRSSLWQIKSFCVLETRLMWSPQFSTFGQARLRVSRSRSKTSMRGSLQIGRSLSSKSWVAGVISIIFGLKKQEKKTSLSTSSGMRTWQQCRTLYWKKFMHLRLEDKTSMEHF